MEELKRRAKEHCSKGVPEKAYLLELGWYTKEVVVSYLVCEMYRSQGCHVEDNREQGVISKRKLEGMKWCGCMEKVAQPKEVKVQQDGTWLREPESAAKGGDSQREVRKTFKMLREV